jgi:hypothetical protein
MVMVLVVPDKLVTVAYIFEVGSPSLLNPKTAGVINCVESPDVITSKITPDPGVGSVVCDLDKSLDREA